MVRLQGQHHGDATKALVSASLEALKRGGDFSLRSVAREAGLTAAAAYHHFSSKEELLTEVARRGFLELSRTQNKALAPDPSDVSRLTTAYVNFGRKNPALYRLMFSVPPHQRPGESAVALQQIAMSTFETLVNTVRLAYPTLSGPESVTRSFTIWTMAHGAVQLTDWQAMTNEGRRTDGLPSLAGRAAVSIASQPNYNREGNHIE